MRIKQNQLNGSLSKLISTEILIQLDSECSSEKNLYEFSLEKTLIYRSGRTRGLSMSMQSYTYSNFDAKVIHTHFLC